MLGVRQKAYGIERLCDVIGIESSFSAAGTGRISSVKQFGDAIKSEIPEKKITCRSLKLFRRVFRSVLHFLIPLFSSEKISKILLMLWHRWEKVKGLGSRVFHIEQTMLRGVKK